MIIEDILAGAIKGAIGEVIPSVAIRARQAVETAHDTPTFEQLPASARAPIDAREIERAVLESVLQSPQFQQVQKSTAAIAWYQSPVVTGFATTAIVSLFGLAGVALAPEDQALVTAGITSGVTLIAAGIGLWGRLHKPAQPVTITAAGAAAKNAGG